MTLKNSSLTEKLKSHRKYVSRTLWTSFIALPLMAGYYILILIMMLSRSVNYARVYEQAADAFYQEKLRAVSRIMGVDSCGWILTAFIAFMFAFQGFSYLFNQSQLDFYLSQPTTRRQRVGKNIFNAVSTYVIMYVLVVAIGLLIAAAYGAVNGPVLLSVGLEFVRSFIFFLAIYNLTVLAMMLSGTMPMAVLLSMFFFFITPVLGGEILGFKNIFFDTVSNHEGMTAIASPLYDRLVSLLNLTDLSLMNGYLLSCESVLELMREVYKQDLDTLMVAIGSLLLVWLAGRARKSEWAGKTIVYRPFRWVVKIVASIAVALGAGIVVKEIYAAVWNNRIYATMFVVMLIATLASCILAEIILQGDIKAFAKGKGQTIMALAFVSLIFVVFRGDLLGYDSYIPSARKIESCALVEGYNPNMQLYVGHVDVYDDYSEKYMHITDVDKVLQLAKIGMKAQNDIGTASKNNEDLYLSGFDCTVLYRFKNGKEVYRTLYIPYDTDEQLLDGIFSGKEYIEGYFSIFNDERFREEDKLNSRRSLSYNSGGVEESATIAGYTELSDALRKDISQNFGYSKMRSKLPIGELSYGMNSDNYGSMTMYVYDTYSNTIELLKKYGIYSENVITPDMVKKIEVTNYYPGIDLENYKHGDSLPEIDSAEAVYSEREDIERILEASVMSEYYGIWYDYDTLDNYKYYIAVYYSGKGGDNYISYTFKKGQVPDFVIRDTDK